MGSIYIDFRGNSAFVADPAGAAFCLGEQYPTARGGVTFGWQGLTLPTTADRMVTNIPQLAGINYRDNTLTPVTFQIDLDGLGGPGQYKIGVALGDGSNPQLEQHAVFQDGATTLLTVDVASVADNHFIDASGVERSNTAWLSGQTLETVTIAGSSLTVTIGGAASGFTTLACLYLEFVPATGSKPLPPQQKNGGRYS